MLNKDDIFANISCIDGTILQNYSRVFLPKWDMILCQLYIYLKLCRGQEASALSGEMSLWIVL